eukprot:TRINITY_DN9791_c0_g2_i1.p1 TRINITY_DN9791_c0_g2~~TRINITY_DN9791_c0_g2_i1.p1  ORF type:complete len:234 (-),score=21.23 TRINITY_DN9791_c0_g2_i1:516-1217(-)
MAEGLRYGSATVNGKAGGLILPSKRDFSAKRSASVSAWQCKSRRLLPMTVRAAQTLMPSAARWWEKGLTRNMREADSAQELADVLLNAGNKLVVVNYFSPGCGACRSLHPKICQFAEANDDVEFLKVNYEKNKSMCHSLRIHVLPFFQFYRGAHGRLCSFSCTNATIKKFKDALAKHTTPRCSLGPALGLAEPELTALSQNKSLSFVLQDIQDERASRRKVQDGLALVAASSG